MTMTVLTCRPGERSPDLADLPYEALFIDWLDRLGYLVAREVDAFELPPRPGHRRRQRPTPDLKLLRLPDGRDFSVGSVRLYLELTQADRFISQRQLPRRTQRRNRLSGQSGKPFIPPAEYLARKRRRMREVELHHPGVIIEVLDLATQRAFMRCPDQLTALIERRLNSHSLTACSA